MREKPGEAAVHESPEKRTCISGKIKMSDGAEGTQQS